MSALLIRSSPSWIPSRRTARSVSYTHLLLRALGLSTDEQIKQFFGDSEPKINASLEKDITHNTEEDVYKRQVGR